MGRTSLRAPNRHGDAASPGKPGNANEIITLLERKDMLYAGLDVRRDTNRAAVLDMDGKIL